MFATLNERHIMVSYPLVIMPPLCQRSFDVSLHTALLRSVDWLEVEIGPKVVLHEWMIEQNVDVEYTIPVFHEKEFSNER
jgi:hypothetical protein